MINTAIDSNINLLRKVNLNFELDILFYVFQRYPTP